MTHLENGFYFGLRIQAKIYATDRYSLDERINWRADLAAAIQKYATPDGMIWVAESGRDCDGVQYQHRAYQIEASVRAYNAEVDQIGRWADGPFVLHICDPKDLPEAWSRDLVMEAYEDGHPHVIYGG